jgi:hypothetical protein
MEETQKSIGTTPRCFLKADISTLLRIGHFYFALTIAVVIVDIAVNQEYIRLEYRSRCGRIIAKLDNNENPVLARGFQYHNVFLKCTLDAIQIKL